MKSAQNPGYLACCAWNAPKLIVISLRDHLGCFDSVRCTFIQQIAEVKAGAWHTECRRVKMQISGVAHVSSLGIRSIVVSLLPQDRGHPQHGRKKLSGPGAPAGQYRGAWIYCTRGTSVPAVGEILCRRGRARDNRDRATWQLGKDFQKLFLFPGTFRFLTALPVM
jgi:hypothetical protein